LTTRIISSTWDNQNEFVDDVNGSFKVKVREVSAREISYFLKGKYQGHARIEQGLVTFKPQWTDTYTETYLIDTAFPPLTLGNIEIEVPGFTNAWGAVSDYVSYQNTANFVVQKNDWETEIYIFDEGGVAIGICIQTDYITEITSADGEKKKMTVSFLFLTINRFLNYVDFRKETMINESGETLDTSSIDEITNFYLRKSELCPDISDEVDKKECEAWEIYKIKYNLDLLKNQEITGYKWSDISVIAGEKEERKSQNGDSESVFEVNDYYKEEDEIIPFVRVEYDNNKITIYDKDNNQIYTENYDKIADAKMLKDTIENLTTKRRITLKNDITIQSKLTIPKISGLKLIIEKGKILTVKKPSTDPIIITENVKQNIIITKERTITIRENTVVKDLTIPEDTAITISNDKVLTVVNNDNDNVSDIFQGVKTELGNVYSANPGDGIRRNDVIWGIIILNPTLMNQNNININNNGEITFTAPFTFNKPSLNFKITATDSEKKSSNTGTITVNVLYPPVFTSSATFSAAENQTAIGTVTATDADGDSVTFTVSGSELRITSAGVLTFASAPDFERNSSYTATVTASDGTNSSTQVITVNVTNVNDIAPVFTSSATFSAAENQTAIGTVMATDADGDSVTFTVSGSELRITSAGVLTFASAPDYETKSSYTATVTASDGTNSSTQFITVNVTDVNDIAPVFTSLATFSAAENQTAIGTVEAIELGSEYITVTAPMNIWYAGIPHAAINFNSSSTADQTALASAFGFPLFDQTTIINYMINNDIEMTVIHDNGNGNPFTFKISSIHVLDISAGQDFGVGYTGIYLDPRPTLDAHLQGDFEIIVKSGTDAGATADGDSVIYSVSGSELAIDDTTGVLTFVNLPDYETKSSYTATVTASDGTNSSTQVITVTVTAVNDAPVSADGSVTTAAEDTAVNVALSDRMSTADFNLFFDFTSL